MNYKYKIALSFAMPEQVIVETVYHYLKSKGITVFFAPTAEAQVELSGRNQREVFFDVFSNQSEYVALFVSQNYIERKVTIEEAKIAIATHNWDGKVIPIYLDKTPLPESLFDPNKVNYFSSNDPAEIAIHLARKIEAGEEVPERKEVVSDKPAEGFQINNNQVGNQIFINKNEGGIMF